MTNITGKIYQMQNAAGTENRFPRTVMEAVLGLNSYLQDQFSALADIYMPIEGISEALTGQEFVYRKSPNTIKAKSLTLDRIKGKTIAWNQLVQNGNFADGTTGWNSYLCTISASNNILSATIGTPGASTQVYQSFSAPYTTGHKYLATAVAYSPKQSEMWLTIGSASQSFAIRKIVTANIWTHISGIITPNFAPSEFSIYVDRAADLQADDEVKFASIQLVDLTLLYSTEIDSLTDEQILAKYEADFGTGYHEDNAGTLKSDDAEAVETTGVNQFDESTLIFNKWRDSNNVEQDIATRRRSDVFSPALSNTDYYIKGDGVGNFSAVICWYDSNKAFISGNNCGLGAVVTSPANAAFFRISSAESDTPIIINLSNESINGQYFPYWKRTLNLGLNSFKVKDAQDNITTITGGLKSAGSVYDEIVGNKYIKRVGGVDLGSLGYERTSNRGTFFTPPNDCIKLENNDFSELYSNIICAKYPVVTRADCYYNKPDKTVCLYTLNGLNRCVVKDSSFTDSAPTAQEMSGVMLYYELATPVEYELVEPLIYTTKAGTTEERISPNSDGLSAPFCCDMTYSANENNDAGNAQYAATAGRLLNTHKIWGQDFNGSEDVNGNLVSNGILQGTQLKSTVQTGTAPLVVSSTTTVANLVAEKASKLLTARTIWGRSFDGSGDISGAINNITTLSASGLATISGGIALGTSTNAQAARLVWDETNNAWHLQGNLYADGSISAKGTINNNTDYVTQQQYNELISRIEALEG